MYGIKHSDLAKLQCFRGEDLCSLVEFLLSIISVIILIINFRHMHFYGMQNNTTGSTFFYYYIIIICSRLFTAASVFKRAFFLAPRD